MWATLGYARSETKWRVGFHTLKSFFFLWELIESSEEQLISASYDTSEFLVRRLEEYERTLSTLIVRFCEVHGQADSQQTCITELNHLPETQHLTLVRRIR